MNPKEIIEYERALKLMNPMEGEIVALEEVPDEVFQKIIRRWICHKAL